jgi:tRNA(adenine34) deaminase
MSQAEIDTAMMQRCVRLSAAGPKHGDLPIAALICEGETVLAEAVNEVRVQKDVTRHAEIVALGLARLECNDDFSKCTLYSTVEPCPMCSFAARELRVGRVVYALTSPVMGGVSKWNVLRDPDLSRVIPEVFGPAPEVVAGLLADEASAVWWNWNPLIWAVVKRRGCFASVSDTGTRMQAIPSPHAWLRSLFTLFTR